METLKDQVAVITGASSGIGRGIALGLAGQGAMLCLVGRQAKRLEEVAQRARVIAARVFTYGVDLTVDEQIQKLQSELQRDCGQVDVLIHSAGVFAMGPVESAPLSEFDALYRTNLRAPYALTQALLPMLRARRGQIVFINSSVARNARANIAQYAATKHALRAVADSLRDEVNAQGVRVLSVYPGRTATPQQEAIHRMEGKEYKPELLMQPADVAAAVIDALGLERTAEVTDLHLRPFRRT